MKPAHYRIEPVGQFLKPERPQIQREAPAQTVRQYTQGGNLKRSPVFDLASISERMYEAAFLPELWVPLLDDLAKATGSGFGGIGIYWPIQRGITTTFTISPGPAPWQQLPEETQRWLTHVRSGEYINRGFFQLDPFAGDWSEIADFDVRLARHIRRGFGVQAGTIIELFNGEVITLEFTRRLKEPRYDDTLIAKLNTLNAAFRHSVFFASRLQFERMRSSLQTLNDFGLPAALLSDYGHILHSNDLFENVEPYISRLPSGQLSVRGNDDLRRSFAQALETAKTKSVSVALPADNGRTAAIVELMPMVGDARMIFSIPCTIMVVTPVATNVGVPSPELASKLFGLTPAEARLAVTLTSGLSLRDSAANQGITTGTARAYLIRIFSKTGTNQQSELVSLLKSIHSSR